MMTPTFEQPMLSLSPQSIDKIHDIDYLGALWTGKLIVFCFGINLTYNNKFEV